MDKQEIDSSNRDIISAKTHHNSVVIASKDSIKKISASQNFTRDFSVRLNDLSLRRGYIMTVSKVTGNDAIILDFKDGETLYREDLGNWLDKGQIYRDDGNFVFLATSHSFIKVIEDGEVKNLDYPNKKRIKAINERLYDIDSDDKREGLLDTTKEEGFRKIEAFNLNGDVEWIYKVFSNHHADSRFVPPDKVLVDWKGKFALLHSSNGSEIWRKNVENVETDPVVLEDSFLYSNSTHLVWRDFSGEVMKSEKLDQKIDKLARNSERVLLAGFQGDNLSVFGMEGEKLYSVKIGDLKGEIDFYGNGDISVRTQRKVYRISVERDRSFNGRSFYGTGDSMLKALSLNRSSFVGSERSSFKDLSENKLVEATDSTVSEAYDYYNVSEKWYAGSREKSVYLGALAARNGAVLTFNKDEAERDFSDRSLEDIRERFEDVFEPNHLVLADLDSDSGVLAAHMAVKEGYMPIDYSQDVVRKSSAEKHNEVNGISDVDSRIENRFSEIGNNWKSISEGRYVSILEGPRKAYSDPVNLPLLSDGKDGDIFYSDMSYGNLDDDKKLEAAVGRYPESTSKASVLFHRSIRRDKGERAVVASEYLHKNWPVVLATLGGGVLNGNTAEEILEKEGYNTTHVVEHRADPVGLLINTAGGPAFLKGLDATQDKLEEYVVESSASMIKNGLVIVKGLEYAKGTLLVYMEFEWDEYGSDFEIDFPTEPTVEELQEFIFGLFPDKHEKLTEENLQKRLSEADVFYYSGIGNSREWKLPSNTNRIEGAYSKKELTPEEIPEMKDSIVFDSSTNGADRDAEIRHSLMKNGVSNYIGFSSVGYHSYSSVIANNFFKYGDTAGESFIEGVNSLRTSGFIYSPSSSYKAGVRKKMARSGMVYGNPETVKDPLEKPDLNSTKNCKDRICTLEVSINPSPEKVGDSYRFNTSDYALKPFRPIVPLYSFSHHLPEGSEILQTEVSEEYHRESNISIPELKLLSNSGDFTNGSSEYTESPSKKHRVVTGDELNYVQAAQRVEDNDTLILDEAHLEVRYTSPVNVELVNRQGQLSATVYSSNNQNLTFVYSINGNESRFSRSIDGSENISLSSLEPRTYEAQIDVFNDRIRVSDAKSFRVKKDVKTYLFSPDIDAGAQRDIRAVIENPNGFEIAKSLSLELNGAASLALMENRTKEVTVPPNSSRTVKWAVLGVKEGNVTASLEDKNTSFKVEKSRDLNQLISTSKALKTVSGRQTKLKKHQEDDQTYLEIQNKEAKLKLSKGFGSYNSTLQTDSFRSEIRFKPEKQLYVLKTSSGSYSSVLSDGKSKSVAEGIDKQTAEKLLELTLKETQKFDKFLSFTADETKVSIGNQGF
ncbi:hypothetical protein [Candidatus Nanohalococcus occultus]|uniref:hypothetical protein n=1 Tax=Candidatus Nanohalococcus occultus TaxID=2978047 RepID=UPI0039E0AE4C